MKNGAVPQPFEEHWTTLAYIRITRLARAASI